jgi:hypothetical protein
LAKSAVTPTPPESQRKVIVVDDVLGSLFFNGTDSDQCRSDLEQQVVPRTGTPSLLGFEQCSLSGQPKMKLWVEV